MNHEHDDKAPIEIPIGELKTMAAAVAAEMKALGTGAVPAALRSRFIDVRAALFQRGVYDPILVRFDSGTVGHATTAEIAAELESVAAAL